MPPKVVITQNLFKDPVKLEINFIFPLEDVTELIVLGERMLLVAVEKFGDVVKSNLNG